MLKYIIKFNDGEYICTVDTLEEAKQYRAENNFRFISRSIHIYQKCYSKVVGCKLKAQPLIKKIV